ncbi:proteasome ATPase [Bifidobacterium sp. CP2]|uniref:proteasome ATPase n=1 Tax=Bifidobacterium sp. CP2 TaxID=2809025 RepID=UPI001BDC7134|nr:proteasome ATPase [Bifidobacterium sp. CP2]MBT1180567.1 proteasome ATPase [Bifidobacterium sp. CP2]
MDDRDARTAREQTARELAEANDRLMARNHALAEALNRAGKELTKAKSQLAQLAQPPLTFATMVKVDSSRIDDMGVQHASAEVIAGARRMVVPVAANLNAARLAAGHTVVLNEKMVLVEQRDVDGVGPVRTVAETLDDGRLVVTDGGGNPTVTRRATPLAHAMLAKGDRVVVDPSGRLAIGALPHEDDADLVLEETPDVTFRDIGGLDRQIDRIRDAVQLPFRHRTLFERYDLKPPKGVLLYGPPGNGKTLIAKAVAHALAEGSGAGPDGAGVFLSVKGPELLNKFVGESERLVRLIFRRARERAADGRPVIVFIDEMDSLLRTRGSGVSSDVETTIVPQFLAELDGVESLGNVMVIGASNRVDMIDPAVLRPGRLDVKIRIDRPDAKAAAAIVRHYLTDDLPLEPGVDAEALTAVLVRDIYTRSARRHLADVRDENGVWRALFLADVVSGASLRNVVDRAKTYAVKASVTSGRDVALGVDMLARAVEDEYAETRDSLLDSDPVQWSRVNGFDAGAVTAIRPVAA